MAVENNGPATLPSGAFGYAITGLADGTMYYVRVQDTVTTPYNQDVINNWASAT